MPRALTILFRRDPSRDHLCGSIHFEGYHILWPDLQPVAVGLEAFCMHGQRLLGLGRHLAGQREKLVELLCYPLRDREADMTKLPGHRVRRFLLQRHDDSGRIYFLNGTPTQTVFEMDRDDPRVLDWVGLPTLAPGECQWFDLAARPLASVAAPDWPSAVTWPAAVAE